YQAAHSNGRWALTRNPLPLETAQEPSDPRAASGPTPSPRPQAPPRLPVPGLRPLPDSQSPASGPTPSPRPQALPDSQSPASGPTPSPRPQALPDSQSPASGPPRLPVPGLRPLPDSQSPASGPSPTPSPRPQAPPRLPVPGLRPLPVPGLRPSPTPSPRPDSQSPASGPTPSPRPQALTSFLAALNQLPSNARKCLREEIHKDRLVTDSSGHILYSKEEATKGKFAFTTDDYDMFEICFESRLPPESTSARVLYFSIFSMCCLVGLATWQVFYLRRFFKAKKLIE
ncbi:uncharacterized protein, partial [Heptranchias perlo]|uniref:uncharacterized protein n=1 Tax=Heptranchias perlo TaxID=212740 RepID=UPI0035596DDC